MFILFAIVACTTAAHPVYDLPPTTSATTETAYLWTKEPELDMRPARIEMPLLHGDGILDLHAPATVAPAPRRTAGAALRAPEIEAALQHVADAQGPFDVPA